MLILIAAINKKRTLGLDGTMPWHCPEDLKFFKRMTMEQTLVMGRKTYEGLPKTLKGRTILQASRKGGDITDLDAFLKKHQNSEEVIFIAGGGEIYHQALAYASKIYLSIIDNEVEGDTFFPQLTEDYALSDRIPFESFNLEIYVKEGEQT